MKSKVELNYRKSGDAAILKIKGRFTLENKDEFQKFVQENLDGGGPLLCIDARELEYVDSSGIGDLIKLKMGAGKAFTRQCVVGLNADVERIFRVSGLTQLFETLSDADFQKL